MAAVLTGAALASPGALPLRATLIAIDAYGGLRVQFKDGGECACDCLESALPPEPALAAGDQVLVLPACADGPAIVLGRIGRHPTAEHPRRVLLQASESLTLKCGDASIDLRADGKVLIRGDDVLLRAKGTQRIRAGTVAIN